MQKKRLTLMTITVIGVMLSALIMGQALAKGPKPEIGAKQITTQINGQRVWQFDRELCSDEMAGRLAGTEGGALAAEYISKKFKEWGLEPAGDDGTYYQGFTFPLWNAIPPIHLDSTDPSGTGGWPDL
jgi:hypothetical protein